jgi:hypothetical protein
VTVSKAEVVFPLSCHLVVTFYRNITPTTVLYCSLLLLHLKPGPMSGILFFSCWVASAFLDIGVMQGAFTSSSSNHKFSQDMDTGNGFEAANVVAMLMVLTG